MSWGPDSSADWDRFRADFCEDARLFPAARPAVGRTVSEFVERMKDVAAASLHTFEEHTRGMQVLRFGNVAVVLALSWMLENGEEENQDVSGYLLLKTDGEWKIAGHAWDKVTPDTPAPADLR